MLFGALPGSDPDRLRRLIAGYALAGLPYLWVLARWRDLRPTAAGLRALLVATVGVRLALLGLPPLLSEDVFRYVWDGAVQWAGVHPYRYAPADPALDPVAAADPALAAVRSRIGHAHLPTIYPPVAQVAFAAIAGLAPQTLAFRAAAILADGIAVLGIWRWAERRGLDPRVAALYAFAPVAVLESAVGGHLDAIGVAGLAVAGAALAAGRPWPAGAGLAVALGTKLFPALAFPTVLRRAPRAAVVAAALTVAVALPYLAGGTPGGLSAFAHRWSANEGAFAVLRWPFERLVADLRSPIVLPPVVEGAVRLLVGGGRTDGSPGVWPDELAFAGAKAVALALFGAVVLHRLLRARTLEGFLAPVTAALLLLSPVVHPWYLVWLLPFCALGVARPGVTWPWPLLGWSLLSWLAYLPRPLYLETGEWIEAPIGVGLQYGPVWLGLAAAGLAAVKSPAGPARH